MAFDDEVEDPSAGASLRVIIYDSTAAEDYSVDQLRALGDVARARNHALRITGRLVYNEGRFWQLIEGPPVTVGELYAAIESDTRHLDVRLLSDALVSARSFSDWNLDASILAPPDAEQTAIEPAPAEDAPPGQSDHTLGRLVNAAMQFILGSGSAAADASMRTIAEQAGVSLKSAYRYFASPDDVFRALTRRYQVRAQRDLLEWCSQAIFVGVEDAARRIAAATVRRYVQDPLISRRTQQFMARRYHETSFDDLWELAARLDERLTASGLTNGPPDRRAQLAIALGAIAAAIKMALLKAVEELESPRLEQTCEVFLLNALTKA